MTGYIRLEGVNIYDNLDDTDQLSVIRGGSLFLKDAVTFVAKEFEKDAVEPISTGASLGLYQVKTPGLTQEKLDQLCESIQRELQNHSNYSLLPFTLVSLISNGSFLEAEQELTALSRFQQLQQLTFSADQTTSASAPCSVQGVRPGVTTSDWLPRDLQGLPVSQSVAARARAGVEQRRDFLPGIENLLGQEEVVTLSRNLTSIGNNPEMKNLHGKVALIYFDGNSFGKLRETLIGGETAEEEIKSYQAFDDQMQQLRTNLLENWVSHIQYRLKQAKAIDNIEDQDKAIAQYLYRDTDNNEWQLRFETLLWGGDELLFVLPAWQGFEFLQFFNQQTTRDSWKISIPHIKSTEPLAPMTHAGGMVFCKAKTPIFRIRDIARELADKTKDQIDGRKQNLFDLMGLESVDFPAEPLDVFREKTYGSALMKERSAINADNSLYFSELACKLGSLPRSQIHQLCQKVIQHYQTTMLVDRSEPESLIQQGEARLCRLLGKIKFKELKTTLQLCFGEHANETGWCWILLREFWDYFEVTPPVVPATYYKEVQV